jgi:DNA-binding NarL/FixJ family response regulator
MRRAFAAHAPDIQSQVARALDLSQSTVRNHLHNVYQKLGVVDRAQAVIVSRENGWI